MSAEDKSMIRATELGGRAVVDMDAAEKVGRIEKVIIDPEARRVAGFTVAHGANLISGGTRMTLPASSVHAIGPDAVTVHGSVVAGDLAHLEELPRVSDVVGRKVVSRDGRLLGKVEDILIDDEDGRIIGYELSDKDGTYLKAEADLRTGRDLIVAPEDAVAHDGHDRDYPSSSSHRWEDAAPPHREY
jgi:sporulation protein YlmC with PRC-barrel domain